MFIEHRRESNPHLLLHYHRSLFPMGGQHILTYLSLPFQTPIQSTNYQVNILKIQFGSCFQKPNANSAFLYFLQKGLNQTFQPYLSNKADNSLAQTCPCFPSSLLLTVFPKLECPPSFPLPNANAFTWPSWVSHQTWFHFYCPDSIVQIRVIYGSCFGLWASIVSLTFLYFLQFLACSPQGLIASCPPQCWL